MIKQIQVFFIIVFTIIVAAPGSLLFLQADKTVLLQEKREMEPTPSLKKWTSLKDFISSLDRYTTDRFFGRDLMVFLNSWIKVYFYKDAPSRKMALGNNDFLYYFNPGSGDPLNDFRGVNVFSESDLLKIKQNVEHRRDLLKKIGVDFWILLAPNKETIYPEYLEGVVRKVGPNNPKNQVVEYLQKNSDVQVVDLTEALLKEKPNRLLFYKTDTHWNQWGAYVAYLEFIRQLNLRGKNLPSIQLTKDDFVVSKSPDFSGDLTGLMGMGNAFKEPNTTLILPPNKKFQAESLGSSGYRYANRTVGPSGTGAVFRCDSFVFHFGLREFLSESFSRSTFVWHGLASDPTAIILKKGDIFVYQLVERYVDKLRMPLKDDRYPWWE